MVLVATIIASASGRAARKRGLAVADADRRAAPRRRGRGRRSIAPRVMVKRGRRDRSGCGCAWQRASGSAAPLSICAHDPDPVPRCALRRARQAGRAARACRSARRGERGGSASPRCRAAGTGRGSRIGSMRIPRAASWLRSASRHSRRRRRPSPPARRARPIGPWCAAPPRRPRGGSRRRSAR